MEGFRIVNLNNLNYFSYISELLNAALVDSAMEIWVKIMFLLFEGKTLRETVKILRSQGLCLSSCPDFPQAQNLHNVIKPSLPHWFQSLFYHSHGQQSRRGVNSEQLKT